LQEAYKNATAVAFHSIDKKSKHFSNVLRDSTAITLSAAYVDQSLKNWIRSTFDMRASFVDKVRESVS